MDDYKIIVDNDRKLVYCDNIMESNGRTYKALADQINRSYLIHLYNIFPIHWIYKKRNLMIAEYVFAFDRINGGIELLNINTNQKAIDSIYYEEGTYLAPGRYDISEELALRMYNKFKEVFGVSNIEPVE